MSTLSLIDLQDAYAAWLAEQPATVEAIPFAEWCALLGEPWGVQ